MALEPVARVKEQTVKVEAVRETVTYTLPVSEAALPQSLFRPASRGRAGNETEMTAKVVELITAPAASSPALEIRTLPPPLPTAKVEPASTGTEAPVVISLPEATAEHAARAERTAWEMARQVGFDDEQMAALDHQANETDDFRALAMRLAPEKREG